MTVAFKSSHPDVMAAWEQYTSERKRFGQQVVALTKELWPHPVPGTPSYPEEHTPAPMVSAGTLWNPGYRQLVGWWKYEGKTGVLSPKVSTKIGKKVRARFPQPVPALHLPGMPSTLILLPEIHSYGVEVHDATVYVTWTVEPDTEARPVDLTVWERIKMSEYHAAREADSTYSAATK